ncbi:MAG: rhomboid family intramembrane serine protease [Chitinophagaceae bacterium]|nr:rhomboid family intramembrane serine protease [Chitinophagaceae bacterium]
MTDFRYYRPQAFPPVVKNLIIINALVFLAQLTLDRQFQITEKIMLYPIQFPQFRTYQIITHMFAHAPNMIFHILFNMFALWMFGRILENVWGGKRFLIFYLACGIGAALCHLLVQYFRFNHAEELAVAGNFEAAQQILNSLGPALGASGAVMGIFAAFAYLFPNTELFIMFIPFPVKAKWAVLALAAIDLFGGLFSFSGDNIAHFAHLGGAITGFILVLIWNKTGRRRFY